MALGQKNAIVNPVNGAGRGSSAVDLTRATESSQEFSGGLVG